MESVLFIRDPQSLLMPSMRPKAKLDMIRDESRPISKFEEVQ